MKRLIPSSRISRSISTSLPARASLATAQATTPNAPPAIPTYIGGAQTKEGRPVNAKSNELSNLPQWQDHAATRLSQASPPLRLETRFVGCNTAQILHDVMIENGVEQIFGFPGDLVYPRGHDAFEALNDSTHIEAVSPKHEQGAGHMAEGYARASGKAGVVIITSGPGVTNMITPMQDAACDGTPMVVFCRQAPSGTYASEQTDVLGITKSCTKWNIRVNSIWELPQTINEAFQVAVSGRPGPVLVEIPNSVSADVLTHAVPNAISKPFSRRLHAATFNALTASNFSLTKALDRVAHLVNISKKPILYVGQGMLAHPFGFDILKEFADKASIPVTTSLQGLGAFDELDPKALHMLGLHGSGYANMAMQEADLIIALGARFDDRVTGNIPKFAPTALTAAKRGLGGIVHFDIAPKNINKVVQATEAVLGDCAANLAALIPRIKSVPDRPAWLSQIQSWKKRFPFNAYSRTRTPGVIQAQAVIEKLSDLTAHMKDKTVITTGVGQHQMFAAQHFRWRHPRTLITSGGLGTMGYGLPAAIGAKLARPDALVVDIDGDASFNMSVTELSTAARNGIAVKVLLCNNDEMGMVMDLQRLYYNGRFGHTKQRNPDYVKASEAFGVQADRCRRPEEVEEKLRWLIECEGPAVLEVVVEKNSPVWPVVPAGKGLHEFVTYPEVVEEGGGDGKAKDAYDVLEG
ncbi:acetolactate synthase [Lophium mytilinum]|uniref:Acetolactate synthase n=1 Tax=Lophium mytilinum TaxID=390894 RepID=A0A6A6QGJ7_9PEZI|nr:acetolactate synthase [Lophium mytilinum]